MAKSQELFKRAVNRIPGGVNSPVRAYGAIGETPRFIQGAVGSSIFDVDGQKYLDYAEKILKSLSSDAYLAKVGDNQGFILMHSVGSLPNGSEIDTPLNYADYYYLEALKRFMELKKLRVENGELRVIQ